jgi:biopolymer transport protein ExbD
VADFIVFFKFRTHGKYCLQILIHLITPIIQKVLVLFLIFMLATKIST